jgi:hypothetical protein
MLLFKHLISTYVPNKDRTISAMHRSPVTVLRCSYHKRIKYSTSTCLHCYMLAVACIVDLDHNKSNDYKPMSNDKTLILLRNHKIINFNVNLCLYNT